MQDSVAGQLAHTALAGQAARIADGISASSTPAGAAAGLAPAAARVVAQAVRAGFADGLNEILIITAVVAFVAAILSLVLIRARDFVPPPSAPSSAESERGLAQGAAQAG
jgi:hypothetical protein